MTNWYVITGGPSSGKTTTVNLLRERGFKSTVENARHYLVTQRAGGHSVEEVRSNQRAFQLTVLNMQIEQEESLDPNEVVFLDRAIPDALAYYRFVGVEPDQCLIDALKKVNYRKIFILEMLPLIHDYARTESEADQLRIHDLLVDVYESLRFPIVHVPVMSAEERVEFIIANM